MPSPVLSPIISDAGISALAFHPSRSMAVTSSYGGEFKVYLLLLVLG